MTPERHSRVRELFEGALTLSETERQAFLDRECAGSGDDATRGEVERLLRAHSEIPTWMERPAIGRLAMPVPARLEGRQLHGYTLLREIGRGGMGVVFLAERSDGAFRKQVAIKLLQPGPNATEIAQRFQQERQILSSLEHPNIARLLDGGTTEEGWPYFVMEYVDGKPIHNWCDERKLNISQRIELFRSVLDAVRYAHQRLVVHRDLKPGNIFVSNEGNVKLLDFGIAKLMAENPNEAPATVTMARMFTPDYASPEQVRGGPITTLTDVYSLGIVLYELLTGHRPYRLLSAALQEMANVIAEMEPARPSDVVSTTESAANSREPADVTPDAVSIVREGDPDRLRRRLTGDLDSILLMALRKEPDRRYGSVEALAEDLNRHLANQPVNAREPGLWYRLSRFSRRHGERIALAAMLAGTLGTGLAAVVWQSRQIMQTSGGPVAAAPFFALASGIVAIALTAVYFFARSLRATLPAALAGGAVWAAGFLMKHWIETSYGWTHSRVAGTADPMLFQSPLTWPTYALAGTVLLLGARWLDVRYGWKALAALLIALTVLGEFRERFWYTVMLPALSYEPGVIPYVVPVAIHAAGAIAGFLTLRVILAARKVA